MLDLGGEAAINTHNAPAAEEEEAEQGPAIHPSRMYAVDDSGQYMYPASAYQQYDYSGGGGGGRAVVVENVTKPETVAEMSRRGEEMVLSQANGGAAGSTFDVDQVLARAMEIER